MKELYQRANKISSLNSEESKVCMGNSELKDKFVSTINKRKPVNDSGLAPKDRVHNRSILSRDKRARSISPFSKMPSRDESSKRDKFKHGARKVSRQYRVHKYQPTQVDSASNTVNQYIKNRRISKVRHFGGSHMNTIDSLNKFNNYKAGFDNIEQSIAEELGEFDTDNQITNFNQFSPMAVSKYSNAYNSDDNGSSKFLSSLANPKPRGEVKVMDYSMFSNSYKWKNPNSYFDSSVEKPSGILANESEQLYVIKERKPRKSRIVNNPLRKHEKKANVDSYKKRIGEVEKQK